MFIVDVRLSSFRVSVYVEAEDPHSEAGCTNVLELKQVALIESVRREDV